MNTFRVTRVVYILAEAQQHMTRILGMQHYSAVVPTLEKRKKVAKNESDTLYRILHSLNFLRASFDSGKVRFG